MGIDIDHDRVVASREKALQLHVNKKVKMIEADVMDVDLSEASVIFYYFCTTASAALKPKFEKEHKPGTRIVMDQSRFMDGSQ